MTIYNDDFLRIETVEGVENTTFYCTPFDYNFLPLSVANFIIKKLNENKKHGYSMLDNYEKIRINNNKIYHI